MGHKGRWLDARLKRPEGGGGGQGKVPCDPKGDRTFLSRFTPPSPLYLIRNASHDSSDLFPPFLGIILYIDPGRVVEHPPSPLDAAPRCVASRRISITSLSALPPLPSSRQTPPKTCKNHPSLLLLVDVSVPRFRSLFENYRILSNSWLGSSLCAATKGVISWIPPRREFPEACGVSYTGYIYIYISFHPSWPGSKHFCWEGEREREKWDSILFVSDQFLTLLSMRRIDVFFFSIYRGIEEGIGFLNRGFFVSWRYKMRIDWYRRAIWSQNI